MDEKPDNCKVATTLDMIVGKWKIAIMLHLLHNGTMRFNELAKSNARRYSKSAHFPLARVGGGRSNLAGSLPSGSSEG